MSGKISLTLLHQLKMNILDKCAFNGLTDILTSSEDFSTFESFGCKTHV